MWMKASRAVSQEMRKSRSNLRSMYARPHTRRLSIGISSDHLHTALICMICPPCLPERYIPSSAAHGKTESREETCTTMFSCLQRVRLSIWSICAHVSFSPSASHLTPLVISRRSNGCCASGLTPLILRRRDRMSNRLFVTDRVSIYGVQIFSSRSRRG